MINSFGKNNVSTLKQIVQQIQHDIKILVCKVVLELLIGVVFLHVLIYNSRIGLSEISMPLSSFSNYFRMHICYQKGANYFEIVHKPCSNSVCSTGLILTWQWTSLELKSYFTNSAEKRSNISQIEIDPKSLTQDFFEMLYNFSKCR